SLFSILLARYDGDENAFHAYPSPMWNESTFRETHETILALFQKQLQLFVHQVVTEEHGRVQRQLAFFPSNTSAASASRRRFHIHQLAYASMTSAAVGPMT